MQNVPFHLNNTSELVYDGSKLKTIGQMLEERRKNNPAAKCCVVYHTLKDAPTDDNPGYQTMEVKHAMIWRPEEGAPIIEIEGKQTMDYKHAAASIPVKMWNTNLSQVMWSVKWTTSGLTPVRPSVVLRRPLKLKAGTAVQGLLAEP